MTTARDRREALRVEVAVALDVLADLSRVQAVARVGVLEDRLRAALPAEGGPHGGVAVRVACAHLAAGQFTDAYGALLLAAEHLRCR